MKRLVKTFSIAASVATASVLLTSCATIVAGGAPKITIYGDVPEPVTIETSDRGTVIILKKIDMDRIEIVNKYCGGGTLPKVITEPSPDHANGLWNLLSAW